ALGYLHALGVEIAADEDHGGGPSRRGDRVDRLGALGSGPLPQAQRAHGLGGQRVLADGPDIVGAPAAHAHAAVGVHGVADTGAPGEAVGIVRGGLDLDLL